VTGRDGDRPDGGRLPRSSPPPWSRRPAQLLPWNLSVAQCGRVGAWMGDSSTSIGSPTRVVPAGVRDYSFGGGIDGSSTFRRDSLSNAPTGS
jgi:hypothetical protein